MLKKLLVPARLQLLSSSYQFFLQDFYPSFFQHSVDVAAHCMTPSSRWSEGMCFLPWISSYHAYKIPVLALNLHKEHIYHQLAI